jgi:hypothetical protein
MHTLLLLHLDLLNLCLVLITCLVCRAVSSQGPVVVRAPASAAEAAEVEAWKADRRRHYPTPSNMVAKVGGC